jgi:uncharacterized membrane protein
MDSLLFALMSFGTYITITMNVVYFQHEKTNKLHKVLSVVWSVLILLSTLSLLSK